MNLFLVFTAVCLVLLLLYLFTSAPKPKAQLAEQPERNDRPVEKQVRWSFAGFESDMVLREDVKKILLHWKSVDKPPQLGDQPRAQLVATEQEEDGDHVWIHRLPLHKIHIFPAHRKAHPMRGMSCGIVYRRKENQYTLILDNERRLVAIRPWYGCRCDHHIYNK